MNPFFVSKNFVCFVFVEDFSFFKADDIIKYDDRHHSETSTEASNVKEITFSIALLIFKYFFHISSFFFKDNFACMIGDVLAHDAV